MERSGMKIDDKNTFVFITLATATLSMITSSYTSIAMGQIFELVPHTNTDSNSQIEDLTNNNILSFGIHFANNTNATLVNENITEQQGNVVIAAMNTILELQNDSQALDSLQMLLQQQPPLPETPELLPPLEEEEVEIEEEEEEDSDDNDNDGGDDSDDNGNEDEDDNEPIEEEPIEEEPPIIDENGDVDEEEGEDFEEQEQRLVTSEGCGGEGSGCGGEGSGWGYYVDDPTPICYPLDDEGKPDEEIPQDQAFCAALGCPYNPPNILLNETIVVNENDTKNSI